MSMFARSVLVAFWVSVSASPVLARVDGPNHAFSSPALSDDDLAGTVGTGLRFSAVAGTRDANDRFTLGLLQTIGQTSRVGLDVWFSQPGAALIDNNLLAAPALR